MSIYLSDNKPENAVAIIAVSLDNYKKWLSAEDDNTKNTTKLYGFGKKIGESLCLLNSEGTLAKVICMVSGTNNFHDFSRLPNILPTGDYYLNSNDNDLINACIIGWGMGAYVFDRYKSKSKKKATLQVENLHSKYPRAVETVNAIRLVRDLINTPADDMGPTELAIAAASIAEKHGAEFNEIVGDELLQQNFPAVHLVGRASFKQPRVITLDWGKANDPLICLVGKGVCFDTGGNNVKPASSMRNMKKDMGGAAHVLGLAQMLMRLNVPVRLKVIISAVENAISGNAHRQGDIVTTRKGLTVEIGHTDAEGRVVLADALAYASEFKPDLIVDFATLTGAARVALGADLPPVFSNEESFNSEIMACSNEVFDPMWPMPLYKPYKSQIVPKIADLRNTGSVPMGGCITAALFLQEFVAKDIPWVHIDTFGWSNGRPGHAKGGDALGMSAMFNWIAKRFG
ncbi:MAG TPA: leucyl aminopeptidase family protein [Oceanospirillales bacterium]|nr:leucyl aminopeptidase family protein [Oceanospirillales bacterium]